MKKKKNIKTGKAEVLPENKHTEMPFTREEESDWGMKEGHGKIVIEEIECILLDKHSRLSAHHGTCCNTIRKDRGGWMEDKSTPKDSYVKETKGLVLFIPHQSWDRWPDWQCREHQKDCATWKRKTLNERSTAKPKTPRKRVNIEETGRIKQGPCVAFQAPVVSLFPDKITNLPPIFIPFH